ncbi:MAG: sigma 54-interacting transcriptional regulator [Desulfohalobiaceae bacterium]
MYKDSPYQDLQDQRLERLGSGKGVQVDVRVLAATNKDLEQEIHSGSFREDLFYCLNVIAIKLPSLRERGNDIAVLARHFLQYYAQEQSKQITEIIPRAMRALLEYDWPGMSGSWRMSLNRQ